VAGASQWNAGRRSSRKLTLHKLEGTRRVDRRAVGWLDSVEEDLKKMSGRNWRRKSEDRDQ